MYITGYQKYTVPIEKEEGEEEDEPEPEEPDPDDIPPEEVCLVPHKIHYDVPYNPTILLSVFLLNS